MENVTQIYNVTTAAFFNETTVETFPLSTEGVHTYTTNSSETTVPVEQSTFLDQTVEQTTFLDQTTSALSESTIHDDVDSSTNYYYEYYDYGDEYLYSGYKFERPVYLYIWEILVILTSIVNVIVISVLLRKKMRNPTNIVLATIAITDSLTGLVTLPTYIMVFLRYDPIEDFSGYNNTDYDVTTPDDVISPTHETAEAVDGYVLTKNLCRAFMFSKYFLSKSFHTMSIFLTLFLGIQRYISIAFPYKSQLLLNMNRTIIACVVIVLTSPILHIYHLVGERAANGLCQWEFKERGCKASCIYLWFSFIIRHLFPCVALVTFSVLFILQLRAGEKTLRKMESTKSQLSRRSDENRRISLVVTAVVIVFLIPEVPYGFFLLYNAIDKVANDGKGIEIETNRAIYMVYELLLVLSFHANFYIYTLFHRRFQKTLYRTICKPVRRIFEDPSRLSISRTSSTARRPSDRKTDATGSTRTKLEMEAMIADGQAQSTVMETKSPESSLLGTNMTTFKNDGDTSL